MRIGAVLSPVQEWPAIVEAARAADEAGLDAIGFWDHYHSPQPEWGYACGWSAYGYLAAVTSRVRFVPMVLNNLHYEPGVLAKESSILSLASGGRFELGIGAGDWPESFSAWGRPFPNAATRLKLLEETVDALRRVWTGTAVTTEGEHVRLDRASCTPAPERPPRVVVGVGGSPRTLREAVRFADEINVYTDEAVVAEARDAIAGAGRDVGISMFVGWEFDKWPNDPAGELARWADLGVERFFVNVGAEDMSDRVRQLAAIDAS